MSTLEPGTACQTPETTVPSRNFPRSILSSSSDANEMVIWAGSAKAVPVGPSSTAASAPLGTPDAGSTNKAVSAARAPAGITTTTLPSAEVSVPPLGPMVLSTFLPPKGVLEVEPPSSSEEQPGASRAMPPVSTRTPRAMRGRKEVSMP